MPDYGVFLPISEIVGKTSKRSSPFAEIGHPILRRTLMSGGDLPSSDAFTLTLLTNDEMLNINHASCNNRELIREGNSIVWAAESANADDKYVALFNIGEDLSTVIEVDLALLADGGNRDSTRYELHDLWNHIDLGIIQGKLRQHVGSHAAKLYRLRVQP